MFSKKKKILKINEISNKEVNIAGKEVKEYLMNIFKELECDGDGSEAFKKLVELGFGKK